MPRLHALQRSPEVLHQNDVAVDVAQNVVPCEGARRCEHVIQPLGPILVAFHVVFMAQAQLPSRFGSVFLIPKQNHFHSRMHQRPARQRISLNPPAVPAKRFRRGKERKHAALPFYSNLLSVRGGKLLGREYYLNTPRIARR